MLLGACPSNPDRSIACSPKPSAKTVPPPPNCARCSSPTGHVAALSLATGVQPWRDEALKLQGLAASFGMTGLMDVAARAAHAGPDPLLLDAVAEALAACRT